MATDGIIAQAEYHSQRHVGDSKRLINKTQMMRTNDAVHGSR